MLIPRHITIDVFHHCDPGGVVAAKLDAVLAAIEELPPTVSIYLERIIAMGEKTDAAVAALVAEAQDSATKLEGLTTTVLGFPALVAAAVADALAAANVSDENAASAISAATTTISNAVDAAVEAAGTDADGEPVPDAPPAEPPVGEDTQTA